MGTVRCCTSSPLVARPGCHSTNPPSFSQAGDEEEVPVGAPLVEGSSDSDEDTAAAAAAAVAAAPAGRGAPAKRRESGRGGQEGGEPGLPASFEGLSAAELRAVVRSRSTHRARSRLRFEVFRKHLDIDAWYEVRAPLAACRAFQGVVWGRLLPGWLGGHARWMGPVLHAGGQVPTASGQHASHPAWPLLHLPPSPPTLSAARTAPVVARPLSQATYHHHHPLHLSPPPPAILYVSVAAGAAPVPGGAGPGAGVGPRHHLCHGQGLAGPAGGTKWGRAQWVWVRQVGLGASRVGLGGSRGVCRSSRGLPPGWCRLCSGSAAAAAARDPTDELVPAPQPLAAAGGGRGGRAGGGPRRA